MRPDVHVASLFEVVKGAVCRFLTLLSVNGRNQLIPGGLLATVARLMLHWELHSVSKRPPERIERLCAWRPERISLVAVHRALVLRLAFFTPVAPDSVTAAFSTEIWPVNHELLCLTHSVTDHRLIFIWQKICLYLKIFK